nr:hypothetical protein [Tanacetum cinerariifolium]
MSSSMTFTYTSVYTDSESWRFQWVFDKEPEAPEEAPPSSDYVPGPEQPPSPNYVPGHEHPPSPNYVPKPEYPEYLVPSDAEVKMGSKGKPFSFLNCRAIRHMALPPRDQSYLWLRYQVEGYTKEIEVFVSHAWRRLFEIRAPLVREFLLEFFSNCRIGDEMWLVYMFSVGRHAKRRKGDARLFRGHFIGHLARHFGLVAVAGTPKAAEDAPAVDKGAKADLAPVRAPQLPPLPPAVDRTMP